MAGVRTQAQPNGKYVAWYMDMNGRQKFFVGTTDKDETERMAVRLEDEHRQIRLGYRPAPKAADKHRSRPVVEAMDEYLAWGRSQGGIHGRPWCKEHADKRASVLTWWRERLGLSVLADLDGILPNVESALRELQDKSFAGGTLRNHFNALHSFCTWCLERGFLADDPLHGAVTYDATPKTERRALTVAEAQRLLQAAPEAHRLPYLIAMCSGLRAKELHALRVHHLDVIGKGLLLDPEWTKNRKPGFQRLPAYVVERLAADSAGKHADAPLLTVTVHPHRWIKKDLEAAKIPTWTPEGRLDFHGLRVSFGTMADQAGASAKESQSLMRHATPDLTFKRYVKARPDRLSEVVEAIGAALQAGPDNAECRTAQAVGAECVDITPAHDSNLELVGVGAGGIPTRSRHLFQRLVVAVPGRGGRYGSNRNYGKSR